MIEALSPIHPDPNASQLDLYHPDEDVHHYVLWSGGCDSTLILFELLKKYGAEHVTAISGNFPWLHQDKAQLEHEYRQKFVDDMNARGEQFANFTYIELDMKYITNVSVYGHRSIHPYGLVQAQQWISAALPFIDNNDWLYVGAIRGDDLTSLFMNQYRKMVDGMCELLGRKVHVCIPLAGCTKAYVVERLIKNGLYDLTWYCEDPHHVSINDTKSSLVKCCNCLPCQTHLDALLHIAYSSNGDQKLSDKVFHEIATILDYRSGMNEKKQESAEPVSEITLDS